MADNPAKRLPPDEIPDGEIEILEVIGLEEDAPPVSGDDAGDDLEIVFDESPAAAGRPEPAAPTSPEAAPPTLAELQAAATTRERLIRLQADFENFKKRVDRERSDHYRHATGSLVARLLPVLDNLERALKVGAGENLLRDGIVLIQRQLIDELRREGLTAMQSEGAPFDPELHEAVATEVTSELPPNTILEELQKGYFFHERVLRPALVRVSVLPEDPAGASEWREES